MIAKDAEGFEVGGEVLIGHLARDAGGKHGSADPLELTLEPEAAASPRRRPRAPKTTAPMARRDVSVSADRPGKDGTVRQQPDEGDMVEVRLALPGKKAAETVRLHPSASIAALLESYQAKCGHALVAKDAEGFEVGGDVLAGQLALAATGSQHATGPIELTLEPEEASGPIVGSGSAPPSGDSGLECQRGDDVVELRVMLPGGAADTVCYHPSTSVAALLERYQVRVGHALVAKDAEGFEVGGEVRVGQLACAAAAGQHCGSGALELILELEAAASQAGSDSAGRPGDDGPERRGRDADTVEVRLTLPGRQTAEAARHHRPSTSVAALLEPYQLQLQLRRPGHSSLVAKDAEGFEVGGEVLVGQLAHGSATGTHSGIGPVELILEAEAAASQTDDSASTDPSGDELVRPHDSHMVAVRLTLQGKAAKIVRRHPSTSVASLLDHYQIRLGHAVVAKDADGFEVGGEVLLGQLAREGDSSAGDRGGAGPLELSLEPDV